MTEWEDDAYVLSARAHGESGAIVDLLTETHGRHAAHVAGAASRRMKPFLQAGARVVVNYRARVPDRWGRPGLSRSGKDHRPCLTTRWPWRGYRQRRL